jgi:hypothetical protein
MDVRRGKRIALGHQARVGKDTFADHLGWQRVSIAGPLYELVGDMQRRLGRAVEKDAALLQMIGAGLRDHYGEDVWISQAMRRIEELEAADPTVGIVVTDMRFPNEMRALAAAGFVTVRIERPDRPIDRDPNHPSEIALAGAAFDHVVVNDGDLAGYLAKVDALVAAI